MPCMIDNECLRLNRNLECAHTSVEAKNAEKSVMINYHMKKMNPGGKCRFKGKSYKTILKDLLINL